MGRCSSRLVRSKLPLPASVEHRGRRQGWRGRPVGGCDPIAPHRQSVRLRSHTDWRRMRYLRPFLIAAALALGCPPPLSTPSSPKTDGVSVHGLDRPVEVIRDRWGVPHIYALNGTTSSTRRASCPGPPVDGVQLAAHGRLARSWANRPGADRLFTPRPHRRGVTWSG